MQVKNVLVVLACITAPLRAHAATPWVDIRSFGVYPDGLDHTAQIQQAIEHAASRNTTLYVPSGTYIVSWNEKLRPAMAATGLKMVGAVFRIVSHMHIEADHGAKFLLEEHAPVPSGGYGDVAMFFSNEHVSDISIRNLIMDMNGANNIAVDPPGLRNFQYYAMFFLSGAGYADDVLLENNTFQNTPGANCVVTGEGPQLGSRWVIRNNLFLNNGGLTDHSSVFAWADDVLAERNTFWQDAPQVLPRQFAAYEIHGAFHRFTGNTIHNYFRGVYVATNTTSEVVDSQIQGNVFETTAFGVEFFRQTDAEPAIRGTTILDNRFLFDGTDWDPHRLVPGPAVKIAVRLDNTIYALGDVRIARNVATAQAAPYGTQFVRVSPPTTPGQAFGDVKVEQNVVNGFSIAFFARTNSVNGLRSLAILDNRILNPIPGQKDYQVRIGAYVNPASDGANSGGIGSLVFTGNQQLDSRTTPAEQTVMLLDGQNQGSVGHLSTWGNTLQRSPAVVTENGTLTVQHRHSSQGMWNLTNIAVPAWSCINREVVLAGYGSTPWESCALGAPTSVAPSLSWSCFVGGPDKIVVRLCNSSDVPVNSSAMTVGVGFYSP